MGGGGGHTHHVSTKLWQAPGKYLILDHLCCILITLHNQKIGYLAIMTIKKGMCKGIIDTLFPYLGGGGGGEEGRVSTISLSASS